MQNSYLQEVVSGTEAVEASLRARPVGTEARSGPRSQTGELALETRITGWWRWKTVIVPPNAFVVHTRRGQKDPLHCGLGISFRFNPATDSFLAVPAAIQTIIVNANCICLERQGVMVQAYVQWIIDDFSQAYRRLDFSDASDPMRVTNVQLQQQAEATIKDTVATMGIDAILSDKQPIIEELTRRLRTVAEGAEDGAGLGLRIVTVQIKEAVVSSASLWENLQMGFRAERAKEARLAALATESIVREKELAEALKAQEQSLARDESILRLKTEAEARRFDADQSEVARRARLEAEQATALLEHRRQTRLNENELKRLDAEQTLALRAQGFEADMGEERARLAVYRDKLKVEQEWGDTLLQSRLIEQLPTIAQSLPTPDTLKVYQGDGTGQMSQFIEGVVDALETVSRSAQRPN